MVPHLIIATSESYEVSSSVPSHSPHTMTCSSWAERFEDAQKSTNLSRLNILSVYVTPTGKKKKNLVACLSADTKHPREIKKFYQSFTPTCIKNKKQFNPFVLNTYSLSQ